MKQPPSKRGNEREARGRFDEENRNFFQVGPNIQTFDKGRKEGWKERPISLFCLFGPTVLHTTKPTFSPK
jgi:hypothetical protein